MISVNNGTLKMMGSITEVSTECVLILREIYKKNLENFPEPEIANGIMMNMVIKAITMGAEDELMEKEVVLNKE